VVEVAEASLDHLQEVEETLDAEAAALALLHLQKEEITRDRPVVVEVGLPAGATATILKSEVVVPMVTSQ